MAVVTITIKDDEVGGAQITAVSSPELTEDQEPTPAQYAGAVVMKLMDALVQQAQSEVEGKGE